MASILRNLGHSTKDAMVGFCFPAFVVYVFAMAQLEQRISCLLPHSFQWWSSAQYEHFGWFGQRRAVWPNPRHLRHLVVEIKSSTLHMLHWSLILWRTSNFLRRFGLTSMTTCLESSNVLLVNFFWRMLSSRWVRLFCWRIVLLMSASSTSLGTNLSSRVGSFFLGASYSYCAQFV